MGKLVKQKHGGAIYNASKGETQNPNGRPKKGISLVNHQLKEKGYTPATKQDIEVNYMNLMNLDEQELIEMGKDKKQPMLIRILVKNMLSGKGFDVIEKMLDRGIGKAIQREEKREVDSEGNDILKDAKITIEYNGIKNNDNILE